MMPIRILIVEDDASTRAGLKALLDEAGYETIVAATFQEGRRALSASAPDLLITDVRLGGFNGLQLVVARESPIPTIVVTAFADQVLEADARKLGADYLIKPITPSVLLSLIRRKLANAAPTIVFSRARRWTRKALSTDLRANIDDSPARVLDISYGGLRFEVERPTEAPLPPSFSVRLPSADLDVPVDLVWINRSGTGSWLCGAAVSQANEKAARAWCGLVDTF